jgi:hypothetical protein
MDTQYTAVLKQDGDRWIGWIEEVPAVNCQEASREELLESLRVPCGRLWSSTARMRLMPPAKATSNL